MSKSRGLHRHYGGLTPEERFRLDVLATARGDSQESERLTNTCPRRSYTMKDWGFVGRWEAARELAMVAYMDLAKCTEAIQMIEASRVAFHLVRTLWENDTHCAYIDGHIAGSRHAWRQAGRGGSPPGWEDDDEESERNGDPAMEGELDEWSAKVGAVGEKIADTLDAHERAQARSGLSVWCALAAFCEEEVGLEASTLLAAVAQPVAEKGRELDELAARLEVEPDPSDVAEYRELISQAWRRVLS